MSLMFPDQSVSVGSRAGFHVLIAGVSAYPSAPPQYHLQSLTTPARTAYRFYQWFLRQNDKGALPVPLASIRLLLSPSQEEIETQAGLDKVAEACTYDNFTKEVEAWRNDACKNRDNVTFFYFAGHGFQRTAGDSVLLMQDFGEKPGDHLRRTASTSHIFYGMKAADNREQMANTQLYFIDACRNYPEALMLLEGMNPPGIFPINLRIPETRNTLRQYAAASGGRAYGLTGDLTLFGKALLESLECAADRKVEREGREVWAVSSRSLYTTVEDYTKYLIRLYKEKELEGAARLLRPGKESESGTESTLQGDAHICYLDDRPSVGLVLEIDPDVALDVTHIDIRDEEKSSPWSLTKPLYPHPYEGKLPRGVYRVIGKIEPPDLQYKDYNGECEALLPHQRLKVVVK